MRAVVFAYHNVGSRCLSVLLAHGMDVALVVTHDDNPDENIWFDSVERLARWHDLPVVKPADPNTGSFRRPRALAGTGLPVLVLLSADACLLHCLKSRHAAPSTCTGRCCPGTAVACRSTGP